VSRDYKSRAAPSPRRSTPGWVLFAAGLVVGLFGASLAWLKLTPPRAGIHQAAPAPAPAPPRTSDKTEGHGRGPSPRFDFYTLLPAQEVVVPEEDLGKPDAPAPSVRAPSGRPAGTPAAAHPPAQAASYLLQMGAYRRSADAERSKASLALLGVEARVQQVSIDGKESFQRVRSGPYTRDQVNELHARLKANGIPAIIIKVSN